MAVASACGLEESAWLAFVENADERTLTAINDYGEALAALEAETIQADARVQQAAAAHQRYQEEAEAIWDELEREADAAGEAEYDSAYAEVVAAHMDYEEALIARQHAIAELTESVDSARTAFLNAVAESVDASAAHRAHRLSVQESCAPDEEPWAAVDDSGVKEALGVDSAERVSRISHVRRLPWGEGFLQVGYPVVDEDRADRTRLFSRVSADGLDWSPLERLPIRLPDSQTDDVRRWWPYRRLSSVITASDGERLVLAMLGEDTVVAVTSDLTRWETFEIPAPSSEGLPDGVTAEPSAIVDLAVGPEGWLLLREVQLGVDPLVIAPADIRETARYIELGYPGEFVQGESQGLEIYWETEQHEPSDPYSSRFVTWEELGIDEDTYYEYGQVHLGNKPYTPSDLASVEVWVADWGNEPVRNGLPAVSGGFWREVVGTDAGYYARFYWGEAGYPQVVGPDYFSADGSTWERRETPVLNGLPYFADMSVVTDGIVLNGRMFIPPAYPDPATESESQLWLGDATGTNWRPVELPGPSEGSRFDLWYSRGGAVVRGGAPEDDSSVEWMMASRDGVNWLVVEDPNVEDLGGFVVNGHVMLAFDSQGNTHRFLLP